MDFNATGTAFHIYNYHAFTVLPVRSGVRKSMGNLQIQCIYFSGFIFTILGALVLYGILMGVVYFGILPTSAVSEMTAYGIQIIPTILEQCLEAA